MVEEEVAEVYGAVVAVILAGAPIVATLVRDGVVVMAVTSTAMHIHNAGGRELAAF